jgi:hypothetical protein
MFTESDNLPPSQMEKLTSRVDALERDNTRLRAIVAFLYEAALKDVELPEDGKAVAAFEKLVGDYMRGESSDAVK